MQHFLRRVPRVPEVFFQAAGTFSADSDAGVVWISPKGTVHMQAVTTAALLLPDCPSTAVTLRHPKSSEKLERGGTCVY